MKMNMKRMKAIPASRIHSPAMGLWFLEFRTATVSARRHLHSRSGCHHETFLQ